MTVSAAVPSTAPVMIAWTAYKLTDEYANALSWASKPEHSEGSLWASFYEGFYVAAANAASSAAELHFATAVPDPTAEAVERLKRGVAFMTDNDRQTILAALTWHREESEALKAAISATWTDHNGSTWAWASPQVFADACNKANSYLVEISRQREEIEGLKAEAEDRAKLLAEYVEQNNEAIKDMKVANRELWSWIAQHPTTKATCDHAEWTFERHGRVCFKCGTFMVDFGD